MELNWGFVWNHLVFCLSFCRLSLKYKIPKRVCLMMNALEMFCNPNSLSSEVAKMSSSNLVSILVQADEDVHR